jgi:hypothetical protein
MDKSIKSYLILIHEVNAVSTMADPSLEKKATRLVKEMVKTISGKVPPNVQKALKELKPSNYLSGEKLGKFLEKEYEEFVKEPHSHRKLINDIKEDDLKDTAKKAIQIIDMFDKESEKASVKKPSGRLNEILKKVGKPAKEEASGSLRDSTLYEITKNFSEILDKFSDDFDYAVEEDGDILDDKSFDKLSKEADKVTRSLNGLNNSIKNFLNNVK